MSSGTIYTETVVHSAPEQIIGEAPYQLVIVTLDADSTKVTGRMASSTRVSIGDRVDFDHDRNGTPYFRKS
jgi:uncharacterized OB-fold protein